MRKIFNDKETEAILRANTKNAFNSMNRQAALCNVHYTCPELTTFVNTIYSYEAELFLPNLEEKILSKEDTTQVGPESMAFYAVSMMPFCSKSQEVKKIFYADDVGARAKLENL